MKRWMVLILGLCGTAQSQPLSLGVAQADITPPTGSAMAGYYTSRDATGTHDPLHAKAMALSDGRTEVIIIACDLVSLPRELSQSARQIIAAKIHVAPEYVMITATHSHTTPVILTSPTRYELSERTEALAKSYTDALPEKIADAAIHAHDQLQPVSMFVGVGVDRTLGFNRRYFMQDGSVGWNPPKLDASIRMPAGPVDPGIPVLYFESAGKTAQPVAAYVNFGVHQDTTGGLAWSADYSYTLGNILRMAKGNDFFTLFTIGAAGNVNHLDPHRPGPQQGVEEAARIGATLAGDVLKVIERAQPVANPEIRVSDEVLPIPVPAYTKAEVEEATHIQATQGTAHPAPFLDLVKAARILENSARHGKPFDAEVQVFTIGSTVAIVGFPGEMFAEFGLQLKEDSPFPVTVLSELANGAYVYIPNRIAYDEGNYEPTAARLPKGSGERLMESAEQQLLKLAKGPDEAH
jgi:neutral ceramidase